MFVLPFHSNAIFFADYRERKGGFYECDIANNKSQVEASFRGGSIGSIDRECWRL